MEDKIDKLGVVPYSWLLFKEGEDGRNQIFFKNQVFEKRRSNPIKSVLSCHMEGWLFILEKLGQCCLYNPVTLESIPLPSLILKPRRNTVKYCILSSHPPESLIVLFSDHGRTLMFCKVGDQRWTEQRTKDQDVKFIRSLVRCDGKLYLFALKDCRPHRAVIDLTVQDGLLVIHLLGRIPFRNDHSCRVHRYLVESCGEIFLIYRAQGRKQHIEIAGVEVLKFDFSLMEWTRVESAEDRVFFVDEKAAYSYRVANPETEGNRIHFTLADRSIYSYHIQQNTILVSLPFPDLKSPWRSPVWVMPNHRLCASATVNAPNEGKMETNLPYVESHDDDDDEEEKETGRLCQLSLDVLSSVAYRLTLHDYINFRLLNKTCRSVAPPIRMKELARNTLTPWLIFCKKGEDICKFIDPLRLQSYLMNNPYQSNEVIMCYSKYGWCLMLHGDDTLYLWNPSTKKSIPLPEPPYLPYYCNNVIIGCEFLSSPDSSDCVIVLILNSYDHHHIYFDYINVELETWETRFYLESTDLKLSENNNPVFYDGELYILNTSGILTVVETEDNIYEIGSPCESFYQSFLLEAGGKLLSVFLGFMGKWLKVFELDLVETVWVEVDSLGDQTLYISDISCVATTGATTTTTEEMRNAICFPRFYGDKLVYYSLTSRKFHCYGSDVVLEDLYDTKEQLYSGWIEPRC